MQAPMSKMLFTDMLSIKKKRLSIPKKREQRRQPFIFNTNTCRTKNHPEIAFIPKENLHPFSDFDSIFKKRKQEADAFYENVQREDLDDEKKMIQRQAFAGLLWSKQLYYYDVEHWLRGDAINPDPSKLRPVITQ